MNIIMFWIEIYTYNGVCYFPTTLPQITYGDNNLEKTTRIASNKSSKFLHLNDTIHGHIAEGFKMREKH